MITYLLLQYVSSLLSVYRITAFEVTPGIVKTQTAIRTNLTDGGLCLHYLERCQSLILLGYERYCILQMVVSI
jgi:hypothetical protein